MDIDKRKHMMVGIVIFAMTIAVALSIQLPSPLYLLIPVYAAAAGKEVYDYFTPNHASEFADFIATVAVPTILVIIIMVLL